MSPLSRGKKKKGKKKEEEVEIEEKPVELPKEKSPTEWFTELVSSSDVQSDLPLLPDVDIQLQIGSNLLRFVKKGLDRPVISEERSLRPDVIIMISQKAWKELVAVKDLDDLINSYRKYARNPTPEEYVRVTIHKEKLLSDRGILRSKLFKSLLMT